MDGSGLILRKVWRSMVLTRFDSTFISRKITDTIRKIKKGKDNARKQLCLI